MAEASRLQKMMATGQKADLGNLFDYLQGIAEGLQSITRWEAREKISGQSVKENDLQHTCKTALLTIALAIEENENRRKNDRLDVGMLAAMALVHDMGEIIEGDTAYFIKMAHGRPEDEDELMAFCRIAEPLPDAAQKYLIGAMLQTMRGSKDYVDTKEARFFEAVENISALKRSLHECRLGNLHFAPKCLDWAIAALKQHARKFPSLIRLYKPHIAEARTYLKEFEKQKDKYIAEFVKRGGKAEGFPF